MPLLTAANLDVLARRTRLAVDGTESPPASVEQVIARRSARKPGARPVVLWVFGPRSSAGQTRYAPHFSVGLADWETVDYGGMPSRVQAIEELLRRDQSSGIN